LIELSQAHGKRCYIFEEEVPLSSDSPFTAEQAKEKTVLSALDELRRSGIGCEWIAKLWRGSSPLPSHNHAHAGMTKLGERMVDEVSTLFVECSSSDSLSSLFKFLMILLPFHSGDDPL
jgi:hypothetical protein